MYLVQSFSLNYIIEINHKKIMLFHRYFIPVGVCEAI